MKLLTALPPRPAAGLRCCIFRICRLRRQRNIDGRSGLHPHEDFGWIPEKGADRERFYTGNPSFYENDGKTRMTWKVWSKPYNAMKWAGCTRPMEDGNFVFMNAVYFGTADVMARKVLPGSKEVVGIPHPSQAISNDDWGAIALFIKQELGAR